MDHMEEGRQFISDKFGGKPVIFCYNPTAMVNDDDTLGYLRDLTQGGTQKLGYITAEVNSLVQHLREQIRLVGKRGKVIHIAHSQGALITALATKQLTPLEMNQIEVLTFGGAAALRKTPQTPFHRCINYYAINDPLLLVVPQAAQALRSGFASHDAEFCFLAPRLGDPIADHNLFAPTYGQALDWEGERFLRLYESPVTRMVRRSVLLSVLLGGSFSRYLQEALKLLLRPLLLWCILVFLWTRSVVLYVRNLVVATIRLLLFVVAVLVDEIRIAVSPKGERYEPAW